MTNNKTKIVITAGEPAGIGPDICLNLPETSNTELYVIADPDLLRERAKSLSIEVEFYIHHDIDNLSAHYKDKLLNVIPLSLSDNSTAGTLNKNNSHYVLQMLDLACDMCMQKQVDAMVTGPVQKSIINQAGFNFTGHTEYLAERSSTTHPIQPVMMLAHTGMRVALATTHLPLKDVSTAITKDSLIQTLTTLNNFLKKHAGISNPEILVCGLNPHAGEDGNLAQKYLDSADAVLAMYHDQGLPVLKYSGFGKAVNVTLGLPFIRTSVDHGTALDLAATGKASNSSLVEAINMAVSLSSNN